MYLSTLIVIRIAITTPKKNPLFLKKTFKSCIQYFRSYESFLFKYKIKIKITYFAIYPYFFFYFFTVQKRNDILIKYNSYIFNLDTNV